MENKINVKGEITAFFNDLSLYEKFVETEEEHQQRIRDIVDEIRGSQEEGIPNSP